MKRRSFLGAMLAAACAPAFVSARSLMPVRALAPSSTEAIVEEAMRRALIDGQAAFALPGGIVELYSGGGTLLATVPVSARKVDDALAAYSYSGEGMVLGAGQFSRAVLRAPGMEIPVEIDNLRGHSAAGGDSVVIADLTVGWSFQ